MCFAGVGIFGAQVHALEVEFNDAADSQKVDRYLSQRPEIELLVVCASETSSGTTSNMPELG